MEQVKALWYLSTEIWKNLKYIWKEYSDKTNPIARFAPILFILLILLILVS